MKLSLMKCALAFNAIMEIEHETFSFATAHGLVMAKRELEPHAEFYFQKEQELVEKYVGRDESGKPMMSGTQYQIPRAAAEDYFKEKDGLNNVEVDVTKRRIAPPPNVKPSTLEILMEVFDFDDGGDCK